MHDERIHEKPSSKSNFMGLAQFVNAFPFPLKGWSYCEVNQPTNQICDYIFPCPQILLWHVSPIQIHFCACSKVSFMQDKTKFYNVVLTDTQAPQKETQFSIHTFEVLLTFEVPSHTNPPRHFCQFIQIFAIHSAQRNSPISIHLK